MRTLTLREEKGSVPCRWRYALLVEDIEVDGFHCESYGVSAEDPETGEGAKVRHVTVHAGDASALLEFLARNQVSPVHLLDVVEDWLGR